jgi:hypothetical protein
MRRERPLLAKEGNWTYEFCQQPVINCSCWVLLHAPNLGHGLAFRLLISSRIFLCSLTRSNTSSFPTRSVWSPSFSSTTFQNFPGVSDLLPEASKFQHHIKLCSKCSTSLTSSSRCTHKYLFTDYSTSCLQWTGLYQYKNLRLIYFRTVD